MKLELNKEGIPFAFYWDKLEKTYRQISEKRFDNIMDVMWLSKNNYARKIFFFELWKMNNLDIAEVWIWSWYNISFYDDAKSITGIDISEKMLWYAQESVEIEDLISGTTKDKYKWYLSEDEELKNQKFDLVILTYTLSGSKDMKSLFKESLDKVKSWWRIAILDSYNSNKAYNYIVRLFWLHAYWGWLNQSHFDVFYSQRNKFKVLKNKRTLSDKKSKNYILILEKL